MPPPAWGTKYKKAPPASGLSGVGLGSDLQAMRTIFDIGSNNGDDIPYYLLKADKVVAFEANPVLCGKIAERFADEIEAGRLVVEPGVLCTSEDAATSEVYFYLHKQMDVLSQFPEPAPESLDQFKKVRLPTLRLSEMIKRHGEPYYAKVDIEHYDQFIVEEFFRLKVFPDYISTECHSELAASLLLKNPVYQSFKLVDGASVFSTYKDAEIQSITGTRVRFSFPHHSAGPFGQDIKGPWYDRKSAKKLIIVAGFGWKDLHASKHDIGHSVRIFNGASEVLKFLKFYLKPHLPRRLKRAYRKARIALS